MTRDRTPEFFAQLENLKSNASSSQPLLHQQRHQPKNSDFSKAAAFIAKDISTTTIKLEKLAALAKRKTLFDDKPVEINELVFNIKQDITNIKQKIDGFASFVNSSKSPANTPSNKHTNEHEAQVVASLQTKLADTGNLFKNILEIRSNNMKEQKERRDQYTFSANAGATTTSQSSLYNPELRQRSSSSNDTPKDTVLELGSFGLQSQEFAPQSHVNMEIISSRDQAITSIESTIAELGSIYQQFTSILATQREQVQRIGDNVLDTEVNVENAHGQLVQFYQGISSNRWLMMKVFGVLIFFFLIFMTLMN